MALLIDGYNLLNATGIVGQGEGLGGFRRSREALIGFLGGAIAESQRPTTTIVFDAAGAPPGLPQTVTHAQMTVRYATDYPDADTLIEELIEEHSAPRSLLVVSSDHRIQRAARRRRAKFVDSDRWYQQLWESRVEARNLQRLAIPEKPVGTLSAAEVEYWIKEFGVDELNDDCLRSESASSGELGTATNPFPPGYADDLLEREDDC